MRIGIVLSKPPGYSETFFISKIKGLQKSGVEVVLFTQQVNVNFSLCTVVKSPKVHTQTLLQLMAMILQFFKLIPHIALVKRFVQLEKKQGSSFSDILKKTYLNAHLLSSKLDWIHFGFATQALGSELVAKAIGAQMAVSFRGFDINVYPVKYPGCYTKLWKNVDKVHSISNYLLTKAYRLGLSKRVPCAIITPAVDFKKLSNKIKNVKSGVEVITNINIVTIARLNWIKGIDVAINAMRLLDKKGLLFNYSIIGSGTIKETERYLYQVHQLGLKNKITFLGNLSHQETIENLQNATIYLQPSINEGFCNAVLEAQTMGKLCIVSNTGGLPENIKDKKTGWLVPKSNPEALANKVIEVVHLPEPEKKIFSMSAKQRVKELFTIEQQQKEFVEFYK